jgi:hypothetical protein
MAVVILIAKSIIEYIGKRKKENVC